MLGDVPDIIQYKRENKLWLVVLPPALGDSILCFTAINKILISEKSTIDIFFAALPCFVDLFNEFQGVSGVFPYGQLPKTYQSKLFDWAIDLSGFEYHKLFGVELQYRKVIFRCIGDWDRILVRARKEEYQVIDELVQLTKKKSLTAHIPVWLEESAPLLAHVLEENPLTWWSDKNGPRIQFKDHSKIQPKKIALQNRVVLLPCGNGEAKSWPEDHWISLARSLKLRGYETLLVIGPKEKGRYVELGKTVHHNILSNDLVELANLLLTAKLIVANDCGPLHLANALGKLSVSIFGPTNPNKWFWYHNQRQVFLQTDDSYRCAESRRWKVNREEKWKHWPGEKQVFESVLRFL